MSDNDIHKPSFDRQPKPSDWSQKPQGKPPGAWMTASVVAADVLQQFALAFNISEKIILLQQPYFIKAFRERPDDPSQSRFGASFNAVMERSHVS
jgi:hypothetical protein